MKSLLNNIEVKLNTDFANDHRDGALTIAFTHPDYGDGLEWLDADETLCGGWDSNLLDQLDDEEYEEVREQLAAWLKANATVSVTVNDTDDFVIITVPADADNAAITDLVEAERCRIGGDGERVWDGYNRVRVFRNAVEIDELAQEARDRRERDVLDDLGEAA